MYVDSASVETDNTPRASPLSPRGSHTSGIQLGMACPPGSETENPSRPSHVGGVQLSMPPQPGVHALPVENDDTPRAPPTSSIPLSLSPPPAEQAPTGSFLWGAQSERRLPFSTQVTTFADRISASLPPGYSESWQPPAANPEPVAVPRENSTASVSVNFHVLLQQLEFEHYREIAHVRAELATELGGLREQIQNMSEREHEKDLRGLDISNVASTDGVDENGLVHRSDRRKSTQSSVASFKWLPAGMTSKTQSLKLGEIAKRLEPGKENFVSAFRTKVRQSASARSLEDRSRIEQIVCQLVSSQAFDGFCAVMIMVNAVLLGISTDIAARKLDPDNLPAFFTYTDRIFSGWFLLELFLRVSAEGFCPFFCGTHWTWNLFDFVVVATDLIETSAAYISGNNSSLQNLTAIRMLRVLRIVRAIRVIRLVRFFKELRMMVFSVLRSGLSLLWSMIMLAIIIFIFSVYLTQQVTYYLHDNSDDPDEMTVKLKDYFRSLMFAAYMLFQCISGGISWGELGGPLLEIHWSNGLVLCFFVFFAVFAVLNIITGIFVDTAFKSAQDDRDEVIQEHIHSENSTLSEMQSFFQHADVDKSGTITLPELEEQLQNQRVRAHFGTLGIETNDAKAIFRLLDIDKSGEVCIEEFIFGCLKMKGNARSVDLLTLIHENRRMKEQVTNFVQYVRDKLDKQEGFNAKMESFLQPWSSSSRKKTPPATPL